MVAVQLRHEKSEGLVDKLLSHLKDGAWLKSTAARVPSCTRRTLRAVENGRIGEGATAATLHDTRSRLPDTAWKTFTSKYRCWQPRGAARLRHHNRYFQARYAGVWHHLGELL